MSRSSRRSALVVAVAAIATAVIAVATGGGAGVRADPTIASKPSIPEHETHHSGANHNVPDGHVAAHSFAGPFDIINGAKAAFWKTSGDAHIFVDHVRLTEGRPQSHGAYWNTLASVMSAWEATVVFQLHGAAAQGGEGMAFWYSAQHSKMGVVMGAPDFWTGLGVFIDTFNNDGSGVSPMLTAVWNDGSKRYDAYTDGASQALGSCAIAARHTSGAGTHAGIGVRVRYQDSVLTVLKDEQGYGTYTQCFQVGDVDLGVDKYFGVSAASGPFADFVDVKKFLVKNLSPADSHLDVLRAHFQETTDASFSKNALLDKEHFQHTALTLANQMHDTVNTIEEAQAKAGQIISDVMAAQGGMTVGGDAAAGGGATHAAGDLTTRTTYLSVHEASSYMDQVVPWMTQIEDKFTALTTQMQTVSSALGGLVSSAVSAATAANASGASNNADAHFEEAQKRMKERQKLYDDHGAQLEALTKTLRESVQRAQTHITELKNIHRDETSTASSVVTTTPPPPAANGFDSTINTAIQAAKTAMQTRSSASKAHVHSLQADIHALNTLMYSLLNKHEEHTAKLQQATASSSPLLNGQGAAGNGSWITIFNVYAVVSAVAIAVLAYKRKGQRDYDSLKII